MNVAWCRLLKNRHRGERVVLVCNGPSLGDMDLGFLKKETVIGLNKIYLGFRRFDFYPDYLVAVNQKVLQQSHRELNAMTCTKFVSNHCPELFQDDALTHIVDTHSPKQYFYEDVTEGLHEGWTVTFAALQVAFFLGFGEVIIIGMDHRYQFVGQPNESGVLEGGDPNHFCQSYFGYGQAWDNPDLSNSEKSYSQARTVFERNGRRIIDATLGGACKIFEKADYRTVLDTV
jgi:hypothetical protein